MEVKGDLISNWTFFKDQWENYKVTNGLRDKSKNVRVASLRSVMTCSKSLYLYPSVTGTVKFNWKVTRVQYSTSILEYGG